MAVKIYSLGYEKRSIEEFVDLLKVSKVDILIDVREKAWSHKKWFCKTNFRWALQQADIEYVHIPQAGNPKSLRKTSLSSDRVLIEYKKYLQKTHSGLMELSNILLIAKYENKSVCLTCFEKDVNCCHRSILVDELIGMKIKVVVNHL